MTQVFSLRANVFRLSASWPIIVEHICQKFMIHMMDAVLPVVADQWI
jgi:hypothetical protein